MSVRAVLSILPKSQTTTTTPTVDFIRSFRTRQEQKLAMMRRWFAHAVQLLVVATSALARSSSGNGVLVVLEDGLQKENFSKFFGDLEGVFIVVSD